MLAESVAGELIESEIEIRSGRGERLRRRDRAPARGARAAVPARRRARRAARRHRHAPVEPLAGAADHRHRALPARGRGPPVRRLAQQHVLACTCTWASAAPTARCAVCDRLRPVLPELLALSANSPFLDGRDSGPALRAHADLHQELPALRHPRAVRRLDGVRRLRGLPDRAPTRSSSRPRSGGACGRTTRSARSSCGSATPRRAPTTRPRWQALITACIAQAALDEDEGVPFERPAAAADRGELLARDPLRARRQADRPRRAREEFPAAAVARAAARVDRARRAPRSASTRRCRRENGAQRQRRALEQGRLDRGGLRGRGGGDPAHLRGRGGERVSEPSAARSCRSVADVLVSTDGVRWSTWRGIRPDRGGAQATPAQAKEAIDAARALLPLCPEEAVGADQGRALPGADAVREGDADAGRPPQPRADEAEAARRGALEDLDAARLVIGVFGGSGFYRFLDDVEEVPVATPYGPPVGAGPRRARSRAPRWRSCRATATSTRCRRTGSTTAPTSGRCRRWGSRRIVGPSRLRLAQAGAPPGHVRDLRPVRRPHPGAREHLLRRAADHPRVRRRPVLRRPRRDARRERARSWTSRWSRAARWS